MDLLEVRLLEWSYVLRLKAISNIIFAVSNCFNKETYLLENLKLLNHQITTIIKQQNMDKTLEKSIMEIHIQPTEALQDPFLSESSQIIYCEEHSFLIKIQQKPEVVQTLKEPEQLRVKVMVEYEHEFAKNIKIQLTSDTEIYFNFVFECNDWEFKRIKANQNFFIQFREYPEFILKNLGRLSSSDNYLATFTIFSESQGKLDLIRKSEFKDDNIMEFNFVKASEEQVQKSIQYRYNLMREQYQQYKYKYDSVYDTIKQKNPSLAIQIQKLHKK